MQVADNLYKLKNNNNKTRLKKILFKKERLYYYLYYKRHCICPSVCLSVRTHFSFKIIAQRRESNSRPSRYEPSSLPLSYQSVGRIRSGILVYFNF